MYYILYVITFYYTVGVCNILYIFIIFYIIYLYEERDFYFTLK